MFDATLITDPDDPRIEPFIGLRDHELRKRREQAGGDMAGVFICEGDLVVERALAAGYRLISMLIDAKRTRPFPFEIATDVALFAAAEPVLVRITGYHLHRGVLACLARRPVPSPAEVLGGARRVVVTENVNNPTNLGIIVRSAAALGIDALLLDSTSCDPLYRRASRVAMGEVFKLPYAWLGPFPEGLDLLRTEGFELVALTPAQSARSIESLEHHQGKLALLFGAEGPGLSAPTMSKCDHYVRIPMREGVDSLNIAAAAAIAMWCLTRG